MTNIEIRPLEAEDVDILEAEIERAGCLFPYIIGAMLFMAYMFSRFQGSNGAKELLFGMILHWVFGYFYDKHQKGPIRRDIRQGQKMVCSGAIRDLYLQTGDGSLEEFELLLENCPTKFTVTRDKFRFRSDQNVGMLPQLLRVSAPVQLEYGAHSGRVIHLRFV